MSKENNNLRLLGSPVNLSYRSKKKDERKNTRNRPRSALQNSCTPDNQEKLRRPYSADTKDRAPSTRSSFKNFSAELLQSYNNSPVTVKVLPPTEELLHDSRVRLDKAAKNNKEICSNASDYGSEDTFISLGAKIKAKAQTTIKNKTQNSKNFLRYRNIAKRGRKIMDDTIQETGSSGRNNYGFEIKITEKSPWPPSPPQNNLYNYRSISPTPQNSSHESYFFPFEETREDGLPRDEIHLQKTDLENRMDTYSRRLTLTKEHLSLVEEESTQDLDSIPSQKRVDLSPKIATHENTTNNKIILCKEQMPEDIDRIIDKKIPERNFIADQDYSNIYEEFHSFTPDSYTRKMSSTIIHTDSSSKDSGYPESMVKEDKLITQNYSLPSTSCETKTNLDDKAQIQPQSLESILPKSKDFVSRSDKKCIEPLNHSRLLYKDFFLKKEGHLAVPPQNTPTKSKAEIPKTSEASSIESSTENPEYPSYLQNSTTKAYTSKVIEDYKKELETINTLHQLTLKDIKTDAISPTPLHINDMFEQYSNIFTDEKRELSENSQDSSHSSTEMKKNKNVLDTHNRDVSKLTTKELIQNYLKVKSDYKEPIPKNLKRYDRKLNIMNSKCAESTSYKQFWNNKNVKQSSEKNNTVPGNLKNQKNVFTVHSPASARIESVQNDKDIESWMSLSAPSPIILELNKTEISQNNSIETEPKFYEQEVEVETIHNHQSIVTTNSDTPKTKDLSSKSTVLDIYSMLKEIESYGENPVTSVVEVDPINNEVDIKNNDIEQNNTPKDNFMEIFEFLEKVEQSASEALSVVTNTTPQTVPKLELLLKLPQTELAQRLVTASLQLDERSCCIALLQESLANHKEQMIAKVNNLEKQSHRNVSRVKQECEDTIKRHQCFIDQLINDKKTLNHRIEQLVDERRSLEERWKRSAQALEDRYKLELRNQHDKMAAAQQIARQRWVRQKAEKIKELTVKGLEGELREMAERQQKEISDLKMFNAEQTGRINAKHAAELDELRRSLEQEHEAALLKERQLASSRMEKQILELELTYQEQRSRLMSEMRAENERAAAELAERERSQRADRAKWKEEQEKLLEEKRNQLNEEMAKEKEKFENQLKEKRAELQEEFEQYKKEFEAEQQVLLKKKATEISAQHRLERDKEIEKAIESMETEAQAGRKELQEAMRRNKEQYEAELKELADTERATLKRYQDAQARVRRTEDRCAELEVMISQLETRNRVLMEKNGQLETRAEEVRASCEESWRTKVENLKKEIEEMKKTHDEQMHQLYAKVKVAVARKDSAIQAMTRDAGRAQERLALLEQKLQQQRKDFLRAK